MITAVEKPISGRTKIRGSVTMAYTFCCGVCEADEIFSANNMDQAMTYAQEKGGWRLSPRLGWVHRKCCKDMPSLRLPKAIS